MMVAEKFVAALAGLLSLPLVIIVWLMMFDLFGHVMHERRQRKAELAERPATARED